MGKKLIVFLVVVVATIILFKIISSSKYLAAKKEVSTLEPFTPGEPVNFVEGTPTAATPKASLVNQAACAPDKTPQQVFIELLSLSQLSSQETLTENIHFYDEEGKEKRIHILPDPELENGYELRLFKLDSEGYPEIISNNLTKDELLKNRAPFFKQKITAYFFVDDSYLEVDEVNSSIKSINYRGHFNLNCVEQVCKCLPSP